jgi:hypothetical protein
VCLHVIRRVLEVLDRWRILVSGSHLGLEVHESHLEDSKIRNHGSELKLDRPCSPSCGEIPPVGVQKLESRFLVSV